MTRRVSPGRSLRSALCSGVVESDVREGGDASAAHTTRSGRRGCVAQRGPGPDVGDGLGCWQTGRSTAGGDASSEKTRQCIPVVPGEPRGGILGHGALVTHDLRQVMEGVFALELGRVDERHVDVAHAGATLAPIEQRVVSVPDREFQRALSDVVVKRRAGEPQEESELVPAFEHVEEGLSQPGVRLA